MESLDGQSPWTTRSKLGEPEAPPVDVSPSAEAQPKGWSFWRKPTLERQLTTSGGGVLEVKSPTAPSFNRTSSDLKPSSQANSVVFDASRPDSPAAPSVMSPSMDMDDFGLPSPSNVNDTTSTPPIAPQPLTPVPASTLTSAPAPSAVSRFFGRLSRNKTPVPASETGENDNKDLELSAGDFQFLSDVPSLSDANEKDPDFGDLLSMESGRSEQLAGLQSMLASKPSPLPAPLAPPPRGASAVRTVSSGSGKFQAKMKAPAPSDMDLLGGLSFDDSIPASPPQPISKTPQPQSFTGNSHSASMWDDFLAPSQVSARSAKTPLAPTLTGASNRSSTSSHIAFTSSPSSSPIVTSKPDPARTYVPPSPIQPQPPAQTSLAPPSDDFDDFEFGTPQKASADQFDDFDFSSFDTPLAARQAPAYPAPPIVTSSPRKPGLDHTPVKSLVADASAMKGRRWPAPASPVGPVLEPPPRAAPSSGFPFLSPPPPSSRVSRAGSPVGTDLLGETGSTGVPVSSAGSVYPATALKPPLNMGGMGGLVAAPPRSESPLVSASQGMKPASGANGTSQGGLSASDLSFFDNL